MSKKLYRPLLKDGDHLVRSTKNPERVRGQSRDANNKNPDIIEWEEVEIEDEYGYEYEPYDDRQVELTREEQMLVGVVADALASVSIWAIETKIAPWVKNTAWPWIKKKGKSAFSFVRNKKKNKQIIEEGEYTVSEALEPYQYNNDSSQIDEAFENVYIDMDNQEIKEHILKIIYHMLEIANEIRILSNVQIRQDCESEQQYLNRVNETEKYLTEKVAFNIDKLLSNDQLVLDINTSRELFGLMGGGIRMNGEYVPVELPKVYDAILAQDEE